MNEFMNLSSRQWRCTHKTHFDPQMQNCSIYFDLTFCDLEWVCPFLNFSVESTIWGPLRWALCGWPIGWSGLCQWTDGMMTGRDWELRPDFSVQDRIRSNLRRRGCRDSGRAASLAADWVVQQMHCTHRRHQLALRWPRSRSLSPLPLMVLRRPQHHLRRRLFRRWPMAQTLSQCQQRAQRRWPPLKHLNGAQPWPGCRLWPVCMTGWWWAA